VERPLREQDVAATPFLYTVLWSDPVPETVEESFGVHDSPRDGHRRLVLDFGKDITERFCEANDILMVIRSHQEKKCGCGYEVMHGNRLVRVFSARDYEGNENDGSILKVRLSRGGKLVVRSQLVRSLLKPVRLDGNTPRSARNLRHVAEDGEEAAENFLKRAVFCGPCRADGDDFEVEIVEGKSVSSKDEEEFDSEDEQ
jgi:hypothetical protein